jgi:hypothetical protein
LQAGLVVIIITKFGTGFERIILEIEMAVGAGRDRSFDVIDGK